MKCRNCKKEVSKTDRFCRFCGQRLVEEDIVLPMFRRNKDGSCSAQLMVDGHRFTIKAASEKELRALAMSYKLGLVEPPEVEETGKELVMEEITLGQVVGCYIDRNSNVLSPSTLRAYKSMLNYRFSDAFLCDYRILDYQEVINQETLIVSPKTVKNAWALVKPALRAIGYEVPKVNLPKVPVYDGKFLTADEIPKLLNYVRGSKYELAIILALHSLRVSEILALTRDDIYDGIIHVNKSCVPNDKGELVLKKTNKNRTSTRDVRVLMDRLYELLPDDGALVPYTASAIHHCVQRSCEALGITRCGIHDLRRSFASLCYHVGLDDKFIMRAGGWSSPKVMNDVYIKQYDTDTQEKFGLLKNYFQGLENPENTSNS